MASNTSSIDTDNRDTDNRDTDNHNANDNSAASVSVVEQKGFFAESFTLQHPLRTKYKQNTPVLQPYDMTQGLDKNSTRKYFVKDSKFNLFGNQQTVLAAFEEIEAKKIVPIKYTKPRMLDNPSPKASEVSAMSTATYLSESLGSGKTIEILALLSDMRQIKTKLSVSSPLYEKFDIKPTFDDFNNQPMGVMKKQFRRNMYATTAVIVVGSSVYVQWANTIKSFNLTHFEVKNQNSVEKFVKMVADGTIGQYDILLVRCAPIANLVKLPLPYRRPHKKLHNIQNSTKPNIYDIVSNMVHVCWGRAIYDDFDVINLPEDAPLLNALRSYMVSTTNKKKQPGNIPRTYNSVEDYLLFGTSDPLHCIQHNVVANQVLNVRNKASYIEELKMFYNPEFYVYSISNPRGRMIGLLSGLVDGDMKDVQDMINGDAIGEAASRMNINATSVADLFHKVLGSKFEAYTHAKKLISHIVEISNDFESLPQADSSYKFTLTQLKKFQTPDFQSANIQTMLELAYKTSN